MTNESEQLVLESSEYREYGAGAVRAAAWAKKLHHRNVVSYALEYLDFLVGEGDEPAVAAHRVNDAKAKEIRTKLRSLVGAPDESMQEDLLNEDPLLAIAALGSVAVGGAIGAGVVKAIRTIKELLRHGKKSAAETAWDQLSKSDRDAVNALLARETRKLRAESVEEGRELQPNVPATVQAGPGEFVISFRTGQSLASPHSYWTGSGWSAKRSEAKTFASRKEASADLRKVKASMKESVDETTRVTRRTFARSLLTAADVLERRSSEPALVELLREAAEALQSGKGNATAVLGRIHREYPGKVEMVSAFVSGKGSKYEFDLTLESEDLDESSEEAKARKEIRAMGFARYDDDVIEALRSTENAREFVEWAEEKFGRDASMKARWISLWKKYGGRAMEGVDEGYQHVHWKGSKSLRFKTMTTAGSKTVQGRTFGGRIGIHMNSKAGRGGLWTLTHIPTGLMIGANYNDVAVVRAAKSLEGLGDKLDVADASALDAETKATIGRVVAGLRESNGEHYDPDFPLLREHPEAVESVDEEAFEDEEDDVFVITHGSLYWTGEAWSSDVADAAHYDDEEEAAEVEAQIPADAPVVGVDGEEAEESEDDDMQDDIDEAFDTWAVRWTEEGRGGCSVTKEKEFATEAARTKFIEKLEAKDSFERIVATSDPTKESLDMFTDPTTQAVRETLRTSPSVLTVADLVTLTGHPIGAVEDALAMCCAEGTVSATVGGFRAASAFNEDAKEASTFGYDPNGGRGSRSCGKCWWGASAGGSEVPCELFNFEARARGVCEAWRAQASGDIKKAAWKKHVRQQQRESVDEAKKKPLTVIPRGLKPAVVNLGLSDKAVPAVARALSQATDINDYEDMLAAAYGDRAGKALRALYAKFNPHGAGAKLWPKQESVDEAFAEGRSHLRQQLMRGYVVHVSGRGGKGYVVGQTRPGREKGWEGFVATTTFAPDRLGNVEGKAIATHLNQSAVADQVLDRMASMSESIDEASTSVRNKHRAMLAGKAVVVTVEQLEELEGMPNAKALASLPNPRQVGTRDVFIAWYKNKRSGTPTSADESVDEAVAPPPGSSLKTDHAVYKGLLNLKSKSLKGARTLASRLPGWTKQHHLQAATWHDSEVERLKREWSQLADKAAQKTWGRKFQMTDYRISGIGSDEFDDRMKDALRAAAHGQTACNDAAALHRHAARLRSLPMESVDESASSQERAVLSALKGGPVAHSELSLRTGLTYAALDGAVKDLLRKGKIEKVQVPDQFNPKRADMRLPGYKLKESIDEAKYDVLYAVYSPDGLDEPDMTLIGLYRDRSIAHSVARNDTRDRSVWPLIKTEVRKVTGASIKKHLGLLAMSRGAVMTDLRESVEEASKTITVRSATALGWMKGAVAGVTPDEKVVVFRKVDYDSKGTVSGPYAVVGRSSQRDLFSSLHLAWNPGFTIDQQQAEQNRRKARKAFEGLAARESFGEPGVDEAVKAADLEHEPHPSSPKQHRVSYAGKGVALISPQGSGFRVESIGKDRKGRAVGARIGDARTMQQALQLVADHLNGSDESVDEARLKCGECGEYWPCSTSKRRDIRPLERAKHHVVSPRTPKVVRVAVKKEKGEWVAAYYLDGKRDEAKTYYTGSSDDDGRKDAGSTAKAMRREAQQQGFIIVGATESIDDLVSVRIEAAQLDEFMTVAESLGLPDDTDLERQDDAFVVLLPASTAEAVREALDAATVA